MLGVLAGSGVTATATFVATRSGVDLTLRMRGCAGDAAKPVAIVEARDCASIMAASDAWDGERGAGIPGVRCSGAASGEGTVRYSRRNDVASRWHVGDGSAQDVVGRAIALFDPLSGAPTACGIVEAAPERVLVAAPPESEAPSVETRAVLAGSCFAKLTSGGALGACNDSAALSACAVEHCELGACIAACEGFSACVEGLADPCNELFTCEVGEACSSCQLEVQACTYGFCGEHLACPAIPRPDGPCTQLNACCTLQAERAESCLEVASFIGAFAGEASCINGLSDWDFVAHMRVPCDTKAAFDAALAYQSTGQPAAPLDGTPCMTPADCAAAELCIGAVTSSTLSVPGRCLSRATTTPLAGGFAGRACSDDASCAGGRCAISTPLLTPFPEGYCTTACYDDATCGEGGVCVLPAGSIEPGFCYQGCDADDDCAREHYRCMPFGDGQRVISACYPRRAALPDHSVGGPCSSDTECAAGAQCLTEMTLAMAHETVPATGGYCSAPCLFDIDCGSGAQCISSGIAGGLCMTSCDDAAPCREGYRCVAHLRDGDPEAQVCMPIWD